MNEQTKESFVRKEKKIAQTAGVATGKFSDSCSDSRTRN